MKDIDYKKQILDQVSSSFCAAKWYNATIWLGNGMTTSCHHPPAHHVNAHEVMLNPKLLHNSPQKKQDRTMMLKGERPSGCEYCWKIEDMGRDAVSDRVYKSKIYENKDIIAASTADPNEDFNLKTLEIAFDRTCNFGCSYCNPAFSTSWARDIRQNGEYQGLQSDGRNHFTHPHDGAEPYKRDEINPYVEAFFAWWESDLHKTLDELRITGGEPMMSPALWRLFDWFEDQADKINPSMRLAINSNLVPKDDLMDRFISKCKNIPNLHIYTSQESTWAQADYIRDGMDYEKWVDNIHKLVLSLPNLQGLHVMCTINALCLETLPDLLSQIVQLKTQYKDRVNINFTLNILRFPSFQSPLVLPDYLKIVFKENLQMWLKNNQERCEPMEIAHIGRLIDYLEVVDKPHHDAAEIGQLRNDFNAFYRQYDQRRNKDFHATFPLISGASSIW